jgi:hypothetical protein
MSYMVATFIGLSCGKMRCTLLGAVGPSKWIVVLNENKGLSTIQWKN